MLQSWFETHESKRGQSSPVKLVATTHISSDASIVASTHEEYVNDGFEGCMVRLDSDAPYESGKRSPSVMKVKAFLQEEFQCIALQSQSNKDITASALLRRKLPSGETAEFSGTVTGTLESRTEMWRNRSVYANSDKWMATVKFYEYTADGAPRFPVIVGFRHADDM